MIVVWNTIYIVNQRTGEISSRNWLSFICISLSICMVTTMRHICIFWITHRLVGDWPYSSLTSLRMICFWIIFTGCFVNCKIMHSGYRPHICIVHLTECAMLVRTNAWRKHTAKFCKLATVLQDTQLVTMITKIHLFDPITKILSQRSI